MNSNNNTKSKWLLYTLWIGVRDPVMWKGQRNLFDCCCSHTVSFIEIQFIYYLFANAVNFSIKIAEQTIYSLNDCKSNFDSIVCLCICVFKCAWLNGSTIHSIAIIFPLSLYSFYLILCFLHFIVSFCHFNHFPEQCFGCRNNWRTMPAKMNAGAAASKEWERISGHQFHFANTKTEYGNKMKLHT